MFATMTQAYYQASRCIAVSRGDIVIVLTPQRTFRVYERVSMAAEFWQSIEQEGRVLCYISTRVRECDHELLRLGGEVGELAHG